MQYKIFNVSRRNFIISPTKDKSGQLTITRFTTKATALVLLELLINQSIYQSAAYLDNGFIVLNTGSKFKTQIMFSIAWFTTYLHACFYTPKPAASGSLC